MADERMTDRKKEYIQVEYFCENCQTLFVVHHSGEYRNSICDWCGNPVKLTGVIWKIENKEIVTYKDGKEIERRPMRH